MGWTPDVWLSGERIREGYNPLDRQFFVQDLRCQASTAYGPPILLRLKNYIGEKGSWRHKTAAIHTPPELATQAVKPIMRQELGLKSSGDQKCIRMAGRIMFSQGGNKNCPSSLPCRVRVSDSAFHCDVTGQMSTVQRETTKLQVSPVRQFDCTISMFRRDCGYRARLPCIKPLYWRSDPHEKTVASLHRRKKIGTPATDQRGIAHPCSPARNAVTLLLRGCHRPRRIMP
ncbi:hypothetical protein AA3271_0908 [Gluconobacter japonicus NBRC 3271]|nr:hypothetical protein AA3271_0908 [Gluconobacter japonicus NBRC 3271]